jgi:hypothetical protein
LVLLMHENSKATTESLASERARRKKLAGWRC